MKEALKLAIEAVEEAVDCAKHGYISNYLDDWENAITTIKEALAQPEQEPVAWLDEYGNAFPLSAKHYSVVGKHWKPLYTTPPQRKPLTDEQIDKFIEQVEDMVGSTPYAWDIVPPRSLVRAVLKAARGIKE